MLICKDVWPYAAWMYQRYLKFYVSYYSPIRQQNNAIDKINQVTDSTDNDISFLIHTPGIFLNYVADKNKTLPIIINLDS